MADNQELNRTQRLIGVLAWIVLKELKSKTSKQLPLIKFSDLKTHIIESEKTNCKVKEELDDFRNRGPDYKDFANGEVKSGESRWQYYLGWAGTLLKRYNYRTGERGYWKITDEGNQFLQDNQSNEKEAIEKLGRKEKERQGERKRQKELSEIAKKIEPGKVEDIANKLDAEIQDYINKLGSDKFQELVKYLFEGMGYRVRGNSEAFKSYIDLIAQRDSLGVEGKIIRIQVKFFKDTKGKTYKDIKEVTNLNRFCEDGQSHGVIVINMNEFDKHIVEAEWKGIFSNITLINITQFIDFWKEHIDNIPQKGQEILPMKQRYELVKEEEDEPKEEEDEPKEEEDEPKEEEDEPKEEDKPKKTKQL